MIGYENNNVQIKFNAYQLAWWKCLEVLCFTAIVIIVLDPLVLVCGK